MIGRPIYQESVNCAEPCGAPKETGEVNRLIEEIRGDIAALDCSLACTCQQMDCVCSPSTPTDKSPKCTTQAKCGLGDSLLTIRHSLIALRERMDDLNSRIQL